MRWLHRHRDPDWQLIGVYRCDECRCGARRVRRVMSGYSAAPGRPWPRLQDRHGRPINNTGWVQPAPTSGRQA